MVFFFRFSRANTSLCKTGGESCHSFQLQTDVACGFVYRELTPPRGHRSNSLDAERYRASVVHERGSTLRDSARETELEAESSLVRAPTRWGRPIGDASGSSDDMLPGWARDRQIFRPQTYTVVRRPDRTSARGGARWKIHSALFAIIPMYTGRDRDTYSAYFDGKRAVKTSSYVHLLLLVSLTGGHSVTHGVHDSKTHLFNREYSDFRCTSRYEGLVLFKKFYYN